MTLTPEQKAEGWIEWNGSAVCPIKDDRTIHQIMEECGWTSSGAAGRKTWYWRPVVAYRIIEAHGADAEPARPTPFPASYDDLVFDGAGWSQTIIVDGKLPEWLRDDDRCSQYTNVSDGWRAQKWYGNEVAIRVRRREPKRETVTEYVSVAGNDVLMAYDLIDGKPDLSTLKIAEDAL